LPIPVTLLGIVILVKLVRMNAATPILVRLLGPENVTLVKLVAPSNAPLPMLVTPLGMVILVKLVAPSNALLPIVVRLLEPENVIVVTFEFR
jgi:hypothetical protein